MISYNYNFNIAKQLSYGVTIAGIIQLIFLIYISWEFYKPSLVFKFKFTKKIKFFFKKLLPSVLSSGVTQINILIGTIIASFQSGAVSYLYYADRVYQINLAIAGIAEQFLFQFYQKHLKRKTYQKFPISRISQLNYLFFFQFQQVLD